MKYESQPKCIVQYNIGWKKAFDSIFVCFAQKNFLGGLTSVAIEKLFLATLLLDLPSESVVENLAHFI